MYIKSPPCTSQSFTPLHRSAFFSGIYNNENDGASLLNEGFILGIAFGIMIFITGSFTVCIGFSLRKRLCKTERCKNVETSVHSVVTSEDSIDTNRNIAYAENVQTAVNSTNQRPYSVEQNWGDEVFVGNSSVAAAEESPPEDTTVIGNTASSGFEYINQVYEEIVAFQATSSKEIAPLTCNLSGSESFVSEEKEVCTCLSTAIVTNESLHM